MIDCVSEIVPPLLLGLAAWICVDRVGQREMFKEIQTLCRVNEGGIWKRIDENRELLELLNREAPELLERCPWIEGWFDSQDRFLCDLANIGLHPDDQHRHRRGFRPWPGRAREDDDAR